MRGLGRWGCRRRGEVPLGLALWDFLGGAHLPQGTFPWAVLMSREHRANPLSWGGPLECPHLCSWY